MKESFPLLLTICLLTFSCSDRERLNPLDPLNPITEGKPTGLTASSNKKIVQLSWQEVQVETLSGYYVWRTEGSVAGFDSLPLETIPRHAHQAIDTTAEYDILYRYAISAMTVDYESARSDEVSVITGPFNYWVSDLYDGTISRISYDGSHFLYKTYSLMPAAIEFSIVDSSIWIASYYPMQVAKIDLNGDSLFDMDLTANPVDVAIDHKTGDVFVALMGTATLLQLDRNGNTVSEISSDVTFSLNTHLAVDTLSGMVWASITDSGTVVAMDPSVPGPTLKINELSNPGPIVTLSSESVVWVSTDSGLVAMDLSGNITTYLQTSSILDLDVNETTGEVWAIAYSRERSSWSIVRMLRRDDVWMPEIVSHDFPFIIKIRVNPGSAHPGLLIYDRWNQRILRLDSMGNMIGSLSGFSGGIDMAVEE